MATTQKISWTRLAAEGITIIASILLAFAIDAWWASEQNRKEENLLLAELKKEAQFNLTQIERYQRFRRATSDAAMKLLTASATGSTVEPAELDRLLGTLTWWSETPWSMGVVNGLIESGKLSLIEDESLRSMIAAIPEVFHSTRRAEMQDYETSKEIFIPFLYKNAFVPQLFNAQRSQPGMGDEVYLLPEFPVGEPRNHSNLIENDEFLGIVASRFGNHSDALYANADLKQNLEELILAIDEKLGR